MAVLSVTWSCRSQLSPLPLKLFYLLHTFFHFFFFALFFLLLFYFRKLLIIFVSQLKHVLFGHFNFFSTCQSWHQFCILAKFGWIYRFGSIAGYDSLSTATRERLIRLLWGSSFHHLLANLSQFFLGLLRFPLLRSLFITLIFLKATTLSKNLGQGFLWLIRLVARIVSSIYDLQLYSSFAFHGIVITSLSWLERCTPWLVKCHAWLLPKLVNPSWHLWIRIAKFTHWCIIMKIYLTRSYLELVLRVCYRSIVKDWTLLVLI